MKYNLFFHIRNIADIFRFGLNFIFYFKISVDYLSDTLLFSHVKNNAIIIIKAL